MKLRTRLPRASTTASVATLTPDDQLPGDSIPDNVPGISKEHCAQILQQLQSFDTEGVFTGALTSDGRLAADGPLVMHNLRYPNTSVSLSVDIALSGACCGVPLSSVTWNCTSNF